MSKLFLPLIYSFFLLSQAIAFAEEGDIERLVVPEVQDERITAEQTELSEDGAEEIIPEETPQPIEEQTDIAQVPQEAIQTEQAETPPNTEEPTKQIQEEVAEEAPAEEVPSEDELEAMRAEESELREVGAGEEPAIE
jgi:hypothetical protein